jgi:hypothetical protein
MAFLEIDDLQKVSAAPRRADFSLAVGQGEFVSFLGPSGCGKTTTLRMVAGFETPSERASSASTAATSSLRPSQRNIGMVFQAYALFPNMTVADNVAFGMKVAGRPKAEIRSRVAEMLALIGLPDLGARYPFPALRRPAAARGAGPRARRQAARSSCSTSRSRRSTPRSASAAHRDPRDPARARHHHDLRHPRPGRGAVDVRPHRGDERRASPSRSAPRSRSTTTRHALRRDLRRHAQPRRRLSRCATAPGRSRAARTTSR